MKSRLALASQICYHAGMKSMHASKQFRGFTLLELIVVIMILATLAGIAYPTIMSFTENARISAANKTCLDIVNGVAQFKQDHNGVLPYQSNRVKPDRDDQVYLTTLPGKDASLVSVLTGSEEGDTRLNVNNEAYMKPKKAEEKRDGLFGDTESELGLYDAWGNPFYIVISESMNGCMDPFTGKRIRRESCLTYSTGPSGQGIAPAHAGRKLRSSRNKTQAQKAAAAEEAEEGLADNIYSWKKTKK